MAVRDSLIRLRAGLGSMRVRTTMAATLVVGIALAVGAVALVGLVRSSLAANVQAAAELRAADTAASFKAGTVPTTVGVRNEEEAFVQVLDDELKVMVSSANVEGEPAIARLRPGDSETIQSVPIGDGEEPFRVVAAAAETTQGRLIVISGSSLEHVAESTEALGRVLVPGIPALLAIVAFTTWMVTGRSLRPVEGIRAQVAYISARELDRRVPVPATSDEIARLARTMNSMLERLAESHRRQQRFVSDASHELRSPITTIVHHAEVAQAHPEGTSVSELASDVLAEGERLHRLAEQLLVLASADEHNLALSQKPLDLDDLVFEEATRLRETTRLQIDTTEVSAARVQGNAGALARVLRNLADNAARHARSRVIFSLQHVGDSVSLAVIDDGPGVPRSKRQLIFERFARLEGARDRDSGGAGLGLAITRAIVTAHEGVISVEDAPEGGTRFQLTFPSPNRRGAVSG